MSTIGSGPLTPDDSQTLSAAERAALQDIGTIFEIRTEQGWDDDTLLSIYERFITERGLLHDFAQYCMGIEAFVQTYTPKEKP